MADPHAKSMLLEFTEYPVKVEYLDNDMYHHSEKGCIIQVLYDKEASVNKEYQMRYIKCLTHDCECSRTGWVFGWFNGCCSKSIWKE